MWFYAEHLCDCWCVSVCLQAQTLRKKASRVEDDNESLVLQLKKMATKARSMLVMKEKEISLQHFLKQNSEFYREEKWQTLLY